MFFSDSYLKINFWKEKVSELKGSQKLKRLQVIGTTRWWSKEKVLKTLFGHFRDSSKTLLADLIEVLDIILHSAEINAKTRFEAQSLITGFAKYETILVVHIYLKLFQETTQLCEYLQTSGWDFFTGSSDD